MKDIHMKDNLVFIYLKNKKNKKINFFRIFIVLIFNFLSIQHVFPKLISLKYESYKNTILLN
jgi:hypothetical protein